MENNCEIVEATKNAARQLSDLLDQLDEEDFDEELTQILYDVKYKLG